MIENQIANEALSAYPVRISACIHQLKFAAENEINGSWSGSSGHVSSGHVFGATATAGGR
jgi:hypothetical protein